MLPYSSPALPALSRLTIASLYLWSIAAGADAPTPAPNVPPIEPQMVDIPAGQFTMGCVDGRDNIEGVQQCVDAHELPAHTVTLKTFQLATKEVSFDEWERCVKDHVCRKINRQNEHWGHNPEALMPIGEANWGRGNYPVIRLNWQDTQTYIGWLNKRTGKHYRLPTEAEWEYAARASGNAAYVWGIKASHQFANYGKDECCGGLASGKDQWEITAPVGSFAPNAYGLYDMHGNVWEWVQDKWHASYTNAPTDGRAWESGHGFRVLRGGAWNTDAQSLRSASRHFNTPNFAFLNVGFGFRLALDQK